MDVADHIAALQHEGALLAASAAGLDLDVAIPTCPDWVLRDLLLHLGGVHRWATAHVADARTDVIDVAEPIDMVEHPPSDDDVLEWFVAGHAELIDTLRSAPPDVQAFTFLPAPSPLAFWARRQAHETAIHRADAQSVVDDITPFASAFAVDGIDELLLGFARRPRRAAGTRDPCTLVVRASDDDAGWRITIQPDAVVVSSDATDDQADLSVLARASDLYLLLWNRHDLDGLAVEGDPAVLDVWREAVRIRWS
jgi:uncharacterized protein (TIGR03083 family)